MSKLTAEIQAVGLCSHCGEQEVHSITHMEAQKAIQLVKQACIEAVEEALSYAPEEQNEAIKAIREVK